MNLLFCEIDRLANQYLLSWVALSLAKGFLQMGKIRENVFLVTKEEEKKWFSREILYISTANFQNLKRN